VDHELEPGEAFGLAAHLADCTACKIVLARRRRLAEMLERELPDIPVDEDFVRTVMDTLPDGPPPRRKRRGIKLAVLLSAVASATCLAARPWNAVRPLSARVVLPGLDGSGPDALPRGFDAPGWAAAAVDALASGLDLGAFVPSSTFQATAVVAGTALGAALAACAILAAAGWVLHPMLRAGERH